MFQTSHPRRPFDLINLSHPECPQSNCWLKQHNMHPLADAVVPLVTPEDGHPHRRQGDAEAKPLRRSSSTRGSAPANWLPGVAPPGGPQSGSPAR